MHWNHNTSLYACTIHIMPYYILYSSLAAVLYGHVTPRGGRAKFNRAVVDSIHCSTSLKRTLTCLLLSQSGILYIFSFKQLET